MKKLILFLGAFLALASVGFGQQAAVLVHPGNSLSAISATELEDVLLGKKKQWSFGGNIELAILKDGAAHDEIVKAYAKKSPAQFKTYWRNQVFSGRAVMPKEFGSAAEMIAYVAGNPNAIGYAEASAANSSVKVLPVN